MMSSPRRPQLGSAPPRDPAADARGLVSWAGIAALILIAAAVFTHFVIVPNLTKSLTFKVTRLADTGTHGTHHYIIDTDRGRLANSSDMIILKNGSDADKIYHQLRVGHTYTCTYFVGNYQPTAWHHKFPYTFTFGGNLRSCHETTPAKPTG